MAKTRRDLAVPYHKRIAMGLVFIVPIWLAEVFGPHADLFTLVFACVWTALIVGIIAFGMWYDRDYQGYGRGTDDTERGQ